jgi:hypothetical protein
MRVQRRRRSFDVTSACGLPATWPRVGQSLRPKPKAPITYDVAAVLFSCHPAPVDPGWHAAMRAMIICFFAMLRKCSVCADRTAAVQLHGAAAR